MNRSTRTLLTLTMASNLAAGCAPSSGAAPSPAPAEQAAAAPSSWEWFTHTGPSGTRRYKVFVPGGVSASPPAPLVVMLHGCTQDPDDFARGTRFNEHAERRRFIVAYPEQTAAHNPQKCWSWYDRAHQEAGAGEPAIIAAITREVMGRHPVDPSRVYIAGVSAGAAMAVNTAAAHPTLYAAIGAHSGIPYRAAGDVATALGVMRSGPGESGAPLEPVRAVIEAAGRPIPLIVIHGAADPVVNPENGRRLAAQWAVAAGAKDFLRERGEAGGLSYTRDRWGPLATLYVVDGLGHAWSGGSPEGTYTDARGPDASTLMLDFFLNADR